MDRTGGQISATKHVINALLKAIGVGGLMGVAVVAPNALAALDTLGVFHAATPKQNVRVTLLNSNAKASSLPRMMPMKFGCNSPSKEYTVCSGLRSRN